MSPKRKVPGREPLDFPPLPRVKMGGQLPSPPPQSFHKGPTIEDVEDDEPLTDVLMEGRICQSPAHMPDMELPILVKGLQVGLINMNKAQPDMPFRVGGPPSKNLPKIYLGDTAPTPRWLIRPVGSEQSTSTSASSKPQSRLPPLGRLRWEFDAGPPSRHAQDGSRLREYAYQYLQNALRDPIVREEMREMIWTSRYQETVAHVEDPLPIPPPPPHFKDQKPPDYANLRPPISASNPDDYYFMYPDYQRPPLASRQHPSLTEPDRYAGSSASRSSMGESDGTRTRASTSSSVSTNAKEHLSDYYRQQLSDDHHQHLQSGEFKWIWFGVSTLIVALFLCLALYAFNIIR